MSPKTQERLPQKPRYKNANAAWKAQWGTTVAWSTILAVAAHAAAFVFWPGWENSDAWLEPDLELLGTAWMVLYAPPASGLRAGGIAMPALAVIEQADSLPIEDVEVGGIIGGSQLASAGGLASLRERLSGRNGPAPSIVQFGPATGPPGIADDPADTREEEVEAIEDAATEDLALLMETSPLDLSRLAAVRPQIVLPGTSAWILIRNPSEVDRFMSGVQHERDFEAEGLVDVAVWIDEWGSVEWAEISRSSGQVEMDEIALALFNEVASFRPARDQGVRVSMSVIFSVPFPW